MRSWSVGQVTADAGQTARVMNYLTAALALGESLVRGNDIAQGFGRSLDPPRDVCRRVLARIFPQTPADLADVDPWTALQWAGGRIELPGHPQLPSWRPHLAPFTS